MTIHRLCSFAFIRTLIFPLNADFVMDCLVEERFNNCVLRILIGPRILGVLSIDTDYKTGIVPPFEVSLSPVEISFDLFHG